MYKYKTIIFNLDGLLFQTDAIPRGDIISEDLQHRRVIIKTIADKLLLENGRFSILELNKKNEEEKGKWLRQRENIDLFIDNPNFEFIEGEALLLSLDIVGIAGSSGSACTSGSLDPSHVLLAIGLPHEIAHGSLRLSLGDFNTEEEVDYVVENLVHIVKRLRQMSPLYENVKEEK